ncbi:thioredoxin domain-containing protein [Sulfurimonas sp. HSL1-6]|uniref:thioredoxin domain-containing protein n=1 Tax=Thiomicrolovo immobilis TaxID=3131935 RepID=UPI0031F96457
MPNRLELEDSPYLQQHKDNPIDWYPWCDEAFERARTEARPIFISIGYSTCHWCHAMEHDVFSNEKIAAILNEHYICIKVDREERPDIDKYYQEVHHLLNRKPSGWPTSVFCTPDNRPIFAGTYITPNSRGEKIGFTELSKLIATKVAQKDKSLFKSADEIQAYLDKPASQAIEVKQLNATLIQRFVKQALRIFEPNSGGFSNDLKFPQIYTLNALLDISLLQNNPDAEQMLTKTLSAMHRGGMYDLIDGGFCRYSTDVDWLIPRFEKMTFDNGLHCELYARAGRMLNDASYSLIAIEIADFMTGKMQEDGLFYSAIDADTEGAQGIYYTFEYDTAKTALLEHGFSADDTETILATLHVTPEGNFMSRNIVWLESPGDRPEWFDAVREVFLSLRQAREYPFIDKKVQTSWSAMMIRGLFELGKSDSSYTQKAVDALEALMDFVMPQGALFHSGLIHSTPKVGAFLEDYAYLGTAFIKAYEATYDNVWLMQAQRMADFALEEFYENGRWYLSRGAFTTEADPADALYPGSIGVIVDLLLSLGMLQDDSYRQFAFTTLQFYSANLVKAPISYPHLFNQAIRYRFEDLLVKANADKLAMAAPSLAEVTYPYVRVKATHNKNYMLCGTQSCFAQLKTPVEIADTIREKFSN